jgi:hypothetical protein
MSKGVGEHFFIILLYSSFYIYSKIELSSFFHFKVGRSLVCMELGASHHPPPHLDFCVKVKCAGVSFLSVFHHQRSLGHVVDVAPIFLSIVCTCSS